MLYKSDTSISIIPTISFVLYPILNIYATGIPGISIGEFFLLFIFSIFIVKENKIVYNNNLSYLGILFLYLACISFIAVFFIQWINLADSFYEIASTLLILYILNGAINFVIYDSFKRYFIRLLKICLLFIFVQKTFTLFLGFNISGILSFLPLSNLVDNEHFIRHQLIQDRFSSFFQEPAHYAEFISILLCYSLFDKRRNLILAVLVSLSIIFCKAATGYILLLSIWGGWVTLEFKKRRNKLLLAAYLCFATIFFFIVFRNNVLILSVFDRINEFSFQPEVTSNGYSTYIRTLRGYIPYIEEPFILKVFGHGVGSIESYSISHPTSKFLEITDFNAAWINTIQYILFGGGVIGLFLFVLLICKLFVNNTILGKSLVLILLMLCFSSAILYSPFFIISMFIINSEKKIWQN